MRPHPNRGASWPSNDDEALFNLIVIAVGAILLSYLLWTNFHGEISAGVMQVRHQEMRLLGHLTDRFRTADAQMEQADPDRVTLPDLYGISRAIGRFCRAPACVFIALLAVICTVRAAPSRFKRAFDLDGLAREQARTFAAPSAFVARRLRLALPAAGAPRPADYALTAEEWIQRYALGDNGGFDESRAHAALVLQLGPRWRGPETATPAVKLLFVAFALHHAEHRQDAAELLGAASAAFATVDTDSPDGPATPLRVPAELAAYATGLLVDPEAFSEARRLAAAHAYTAPAMMTLLNVARMRHGVLAPAQFAWLKLVDRPLWYALHSLGFETEGVGRYLHPAPRVEAVGARDHWAVERAAGEPVFEPDLVQAMAALRQSSPARGAILPVGRQARPSAHPPAAAP
jgi:intracellular multiplication protein IcmP